MNRYSIRENIAISAGAGTGKTFVLSRRYINILLGFEFFRVNEEAYLKADYNTKEVEILRAEPNEIVTITYTEAAAAEMRDRINALISEIIAVIEKDEITKDNTINTALKYYTEYKTKIADRLKECRHLMIYSNISTIHSFAFEIVKKHSDVLKIDISPDIISSDEKSVLISKSIETALSKNEADTFKITKLLGEFKLNKIIKKYIEDGTFRNNFKNLLSNKEKLDDKILYVLRCIYSNKIINCVINLEKLKDYAKQEGYSKFLETFKAVCKYVLNPQKTPIITEFINVMTTDKEIEDIKILFKADYNKLRDFAKISFDKNIENEYLNLLSIVYKLIDSIYIEYKERLKNRNIIDFDLILDKAEGLIYTIDDIKTFRYFMIDEFQDTNDFQWNMLHKLAMKGNTNIFLVGDEKQSIYSFQGADVSVFQKASNDISAIKVSLNDNYRSRKHILKFVNDLFRVMLKKENKIDEIEIKNIEDNDLRAIAEKARKYNRKLITEIEYNELSEGNNKKRNGRTTWLLNEPLKKEELEDDNINPKDIEFQNIASFIKRIKKGELKEFENITKLLNENKPAIGILFNSKDDMLNLKDSLNSFNLSARLKSGDDFYKTIEIMEMYNVLNSVVILKERSEWKYIGKDLYSITGALRSNIFRINDNEILRIVREEDYITIKDLFDDLINCSEIFSISELISYISDKYNLLTIYRHFENYEQMASNIEKLIIRAKIFEKEHLSDLKEFLTEMKNFIFFTKEISEISAAYRADGQNSIELNTIHGSKGLQYPMVIMVQCDKSLTTVHSSETIKHTDIRLEDDALSLIGFKIDEKETLTKHVTGIISSEKNIEERKRLLYVALTRAEEDIVISVPHLTNRNMTGNFTTYFNFLKEQYNINLNNVINEYFANEENKVYDKLFNISGVGNSSFLLLKNESKTGKTYKITKIPKIKLKNVKIDFGKQFSSVTGEVTDKVFLNYNDRDPAVTGNAFHELAALYIKDFEDDKIIEKAVTKVSAKYELDSKEENNIKRFVNNLKSSDIYNDITSANNIYPEFPFTIKNEDGQTINGIIDLVYEKKGILNVLDYKTNSLEKKNAKAITKDNGYDKQIEQYANVVEKVTGNNVAKKILFYADKGEVVEV